MFLFRRTKRLKKAAIALPFLLGITATAADARPSKTVVLAPSSKWHSKWEEKTCVLARAFGTGKDRILLRFERFGPSGGFQLVLTGAMLTPIKPFARFSIAYEPNVSVHKVENLLVSKTYDGTRSVFISSTALLKPLGKGAPSPKITPAIERAVTQISVFSVRNKTVTLATGALDRPMAALRACTDDLVKQWGLDPKVRNTLSRAVKPLTPSQSWLKSRHYPWFESLRGQSSIVNFRLLVDEHGAPTDCEIQRSYSGENFDARTCELIMRNARFAPALDSSGTPVASFYINTVSWIMK